MLPTRYLVRGLLAAVRVVGRPVGGVLPNKQSKKRAGAGKTRPIRRVAGRARGAGAAEDRPQPAQRRPNAVARAARVRTARAVRREASSRPRDRTGVKRTSTRRKSPSVAADRRGRAPAVRPWQRHSQPRSARADLRLRLAVARSVNQRPAISLSRGLVAEFAAVAVCLLAAGLFAVAAIPDGHGARAAPIARTVEPSVTAPASGTDGHSDASLRAPTPS